MTERMGPEMNATMLAVYEDALVLRVLWDLDTGPLWHEYHKPCLCDDCTR